MLTKALNTIKKHSMLKPQDNILVALSGGADSTALLAILSELRIEFSLTIHALYIDHRLRPLETPQEIEHCKRLCCRFDIPFHVESIDVRAYCVKNKTAIQEGARELRYECLNSKTLELGCNKIALGHNADDQAETVIMRLIRGSGVSGLAGIPPVRGMIIRPLIETTRAEIEEYLIGNAERYGLNTAAPYIIESSNLKTDYLRNSIRLRLMPEIKAISSGFINTITRTTEIIRDEERYFELIVTKTLMRLITRKGEGFIELFWQPMEGIDRAVLRRLLRRAIDNTRGLRGISFINIEDIVELIKTGNSGSRIYISKDVRVIKGYSTLLITSQCPAYLAEQTVNSAGDVVLKDSGMVISISLKEIAEIRDYGDGKLRAVVDANKASLPLCIRARRSGDFFYPLGLGRKKKLQDYFVDQKVPRDERDCVPIVTCGEEIVWVAGHRIDQRYAVDNDTRTVLEFMVKPLKN